MIAEYSVTKMLAQLERDDLLPVILFRSARRQCDLDIEKLNAARMGKFSAQKQQLILDEVDAILLKYKLDEQVIKKHPQFKALVTMGAGAHHAGQLLQWRLLLEELMTRGKLRVMVATGTVAAGVDFPARSVLITAHSKRGTEGFATLSASEFQQMSGRAGRRGRDAVGFCIIAPGAYSDARVLHQVIQKPPEPLRSAYFAAPATVLNLLKFRSVDDLTYTVERSLAGFLDRKSATGLEAQAALEESEVDNNKQISSGSELFKRAHKRIRRLRRDAEILRTRQVTFLTRTLEALEKLGYLEKNSLSEKGLWAANLCTSLVLELGEAVADFLFADLGVEELTALVASIAADPHRPYLSIRKNPIKKELFRELGEKVIRVRQVYQNPLTSEIAVVPDAAVTILSWMESESWESFSSLLRLSGAAEGDVSRLVTQTADHLNQLSRLYESHPELAKTAAEGRKRILKPPFVENIAVV